MIDPKNLSIRSFALIGDAVYEVFIREITVLKTENINKLHKINISVVNGEFQASLLDKMESFLTEFEKDLIRRGRNTSVTTAKRTNHTIHRLSTAFEALIGYLHLNDKERLNKILEKLTPIILEEVNKN
jgi:ribonuclease III family protein